MGYGTFTKNNGESVNFGFSSVTDWFDSIIESFPAPGTQIFDSRAVLVLTVWMAWWKMTEERPAEKMGNHFMVTMDASYLERTADIAEQEYGLIKKETEPKNAGSQGAGPRAGPCPDRLQKGKRVKILCRILSSAGYALAIACNEPPPWLWVAALVVGIVIGRMV